MCIWGRFGRSLAFRNFHTGDMESLDNSIDFEAVREFLLQLRSYMNRQDFIQSEIVLQSLYSSFSYSFIDSMVEEYLQPETTQSLFDFLGM